MHVLLRYCKIKTKMERKGKKKKREKQKRQIKEKERGELFVGNRNYNLKT